MEILVEDLAKACNYTLDYLLKLLREHNVENRILLNENDLVKLRNGLKIVSHKAYSLRIELDKLLSDTLKVVS